MLVCLVFVLLTYPALRAYAARVERSDAEPVDKVHRLRRITLVLIGMALVVAVLAAVETSQERHLWPGRDWLRPVGRVAVFVALFTAIVLGQLALRPAYQRLRGIDAAKAKAARTPARTARSLVLALPALVWAGVLIALPRLGAPLWSILPALVAMLLTVAVLSPLLLRLAIPTTEPDERVRRIVGELCDRAWVQLRDVRVLDTRAHPVANAMFSGLGPGPKYVFVTDVLVDQLSDEQLEAVVAHEIGHLKGHHIAKRQGSLIAALLLTLAATTGTAYGVRHGWPTALAIVLGIVAVATLFAPFLLTALVAIRQERQADDYAAGLVGPRPLADALERLAEINMMRRRTSRGWNLLTKHPGFAQRIERLRGYEERPVSCGVPS